MTLTSYFALKWLRNISVLQSRGCCGGSTFSRKVREAIFFAAVQPDLVKFDPAIGKTKKFHTYSYHSYGLVTGL